MTLALALDLALAVLLAVTIAYAALLNRKLALLRRERRQLDGASGGLQETLAHAEHGIGNLKEAMDGLQARMETARTLGDDLRFLVERGEAVADALEKRLRQAAPAPARPAPQVKRQAADTNSRLQRRTPEQEDEPSSDAERELLKALGAARQAG